jgi:hypothetical protein
MDEDSRSGNRPSDAERGQHAEAGEPTPVISVTPNRQVSGEPVGIGGSGFGAGIVTRTVFFGDLATEPMGKPTSLRAIVPDVGGSRSAPVRLAVHYESSGTTKISLAKPFQILERKVPSFALDRGQAYVGDTVVLSGDGMGPGPQHGFGGSPYAVLFNGKPVPVADPSAWSPTRISLSVPGETLGLVEVRVATPWGTSPARQLTVLQPPTIAEEAIAAIPDGEFTLTGGGFGSSGELVFEGPGVAPIPAETSRWSETEIVARVPGVGRLKPLEHTTITVRAQGRADSIPYTFLARRSVTSWTRLEAHARTEDLQEGLRRGLEARVYDPAWLLARQWQLGEFQGEDAGSPVSVRLEGETAALVRWRPRGGPPRDLPRGPATPLAALVERETYPAEPQIVAGWSLRLAVESGLHFLRLLAGAVKHAERRARYRKRYLELYPFRAPAAGEKLDAAALRYALVAQGRALDGRALYAALRDVVQSGKLPAEPKIQQQDKAAVVKAIRAWYGWAQRLLSRGPGAEDAWDPERLEYRFAVSAETSEGEVVLDASEHTGAPIDWHSFSVDPSASLRDGAGGPKVSRLERDVLPMPAGFPGMPASRWWQLEPAEIDFGGIPAGPADLARLVLIEFASLLGNDWLVVPLGGIEAGSLVALDAVRVTNAFGETGEPLAPLSSQRFRLFEFSVPAGGTGETSGKLFLPPALPAPIEGVPLEDVSLIRDEMANLVWAIERTVEGEAERPLDRFESEQLRRATEPGSSAPVTGAGLAYGLVDAPPRHWLPFERVDGAAPRLKRRGPAEPLGTLLAADAAIYDEEVPPTGVRVTRAYRYARAADGSTHLWMRRRKRAGRREPSSGLRFDYLEPSE